MKLKDLIIEVYQEEENGSFTHDGVEYDLNKLFELTELEPIAYFDVNDLKWILDQTNIDVHRVPTADLTVPILVTSYEHTWVVLDGVHRLTKALQDNLTLLPGRVVSAAILKMIELK